MLSKLSDWCFPERCYHCGEGAAPLCLDCSPLLHLLSLEGRCPRCSKVLQGERCSCTQSLFPFRRLSAALENQGPAKALIKQIKSGGVPEHIRGMAGFLVAKHLELSWPIPDLIVGVPSSLLVRWKRGFCVGTLLARAVGNILERPSCFLLRKTIGTIPQELLSLKDRERLSHPFTWVGGEQVEDQTLLLVDDYMVSGATMKEAGKALLSGSPSAIYGLTFAMN